LEDAVRSAAKRFSTFWYAAALFAACLFIHPLIEADSGEREALTNGGEPESPTAAWLPLSLVWFDAYQLFPSPFESLSAEVERIFAELGVGVRWEMGGEVLDGEETIDDPLRLYVVLLPTEPSTWGLGEHVMGAATHGKGKKGSVYLFYPQIINTLGFDAMNAPGGTERLARAIGRIVVHELVHVLAPHHPHTDTGLMNRHLTGRFLMRPKVHLDDVSSSVVREEIRRLGNHVILATGDFGGEPAVDRVKGSSRRPE
jgi:hypothetical protein